MSKRNPWSTARRRPPAAAANTELPARRQSISLAEREERLERAIQRELRDGARLESREATTAVLVRGRRVNHALHFGLSIVTLGWWLVVWFVWARHRGFRRLTLVVAEDGSIVEL